MKKSLFIIVISFSFLLPAQEQSISLEASANISCEGITKESLKEKKKECKQISDKKDRKSCLEDVKVAKKCLKKHNRGPKLCKALVKLITKRIMNHAKEKYSHNKEYLKSLKKSIRSDKKELLKNCRIQ